MGTCWEYLLGETFNVYCDESCHLEHDESTVMVLGAVWCPLDKRREIIERLREIKATHGVGRDFEIKWTKVSPGKVKFYQDLIDYFFDDDDLHLRALVVADKSILRHDTFEQTYDQWYYKMYYTMLKVIFTPQDCYRVYLDIKDTRGAAKIRKLHEVLANSLDDFSRSIIERMQLVRSHEIELLQLTDLLIGAIAYANRGLESNEAKIALVERIRKRSGYHLNRTTLNRETKVNILIWHSTESE